jgi:hypothetical protein
MAIKSLRVTKKEIQTYFTPKVSDYELMVNSINSTMGYGQIIQRYIGDNILNTFYHVYSITYDTQIVYDRTTGQQSYVETAGPTFWGVSSVIGMEFLNGITDIPNLRKLKYCDGCLDGNGLNKPVIDNFSKRFKQLSELVYGYNLSEGFLFYDESLPKYSNVFPSIKVDDGVNVNYKFKNVNTSADLTVSQMSQITGQPVSLIEFSVDTAPVVKPQEGANTVITSCCDESISYVISGQYTIGNILYTDSVTESYCWYVESLTNSDPTLPLSFIFSSGGRSCQVCINLNPCPSVCDTVILTYSTNPATACMGEPSPYQTDGEILYEDGACGTVTAPIGYYGESRSGRVYYWNGIAFEQYGLCPQDNYLIEWCCDGSQQVISSGGKSIMVGSTIFFDTRGLYPINCWYVKGNTTAPTTIEGELTGSTYLDCDDCQNQLGEFCRR